MRPGFKLFAVSLALSVATTAIAQSDLNPSDGIALSIVEPMTLEQFADALRAASGRPVLIGLTAERAYLRNDRGHRLKVSWTGPLRPLLNGVAPRYGVQWAEDGDTILLFDDASARPKAPPAIRAVAVPASSSPKPAEIVKAVTPPPPPAVEIPAPIPAKIETVAAALPVATPPTQPPAVAALPMPALQPAVFMQPVAPSPLVAPAPVASSNYYPAAPVQPEPQAAYAPAPVAAPAPAPVAYAPPVPIARTISYGPPSPVVQQIPYTPAAVRPAPPQPVTYVAPMRSVPVSRPAPAATTAPDSRLSVIRQANTQSTQAPTASGFVNSTMFYDYMPGAIYELHSSPRFISTIALRPGERLISKAAGDTVRWVMGETRQGEGASAQTLVFVKPIRGDLRTNIVITTNERTYMIEAISHTSDAYTSVMSWNYPRDQFAEMAALQAQADAAEAAAVASAREDIEAEEDSRMGGLSLDRLNFGYKIKPVGGRKPHWTPNNVFDDGSKTYIQFAPDLDTGEAPPLFVVGESGRAELVNYRVNGQYYVVDRLITTAELRLGEEKQQIVRISRKSSRAVS